jgi:hypothetical protein
MLIGFKECSTSYLDSPLSQVTSWQNPQADNWAVYLRSFRTLEDAKLEQGSFPNRSIDIVRLNNGKFYLFIFADNEKEAKGQHTSTVKERWEKSRVIPFDRCTKSPNGRNGYFNCE